MPLETRRPVTTDSESDPVTCLAYLGLSHTTENESRRSWRQKNSSRKTLEIKRYAM